MIDLLQSENWVGRATRAVIVEFTLYNPTINTLSVCSLFFELLQTGQATTFKHIDTISLYNTESILQVFQGLCLIIFMAMVSYKMFEVITTLIRQGRLCLCSVWYWLDLGHLNSCTFLCSELSSLTTQLRAHKTCSAISLLQSIFRGLFYGRTLKTACWPFSLSLQQSSYYNCPTLTCIHVRFPMLCAFGCGTCSFSSLFF